MLHCEQHLINNPQNYSDTNYCEIKKINSCYSVTNSSLKCICTLYSFYYVPTKLITMEIANVISHVSNMYNDLDL